MNRQTFDKNPNDGTALEVLGIDDPNECDDSWFECQRHEVEKQREVITLRSNGAIYTTGDALIGVFCPQCRNECCQLYSVKGLRAYVRIRMKQLFNEWDEGETRNDLFQYVCEEDELEEMDIASPFSATGDGQ